MSLAITGAAAARRYWYTVSRLIPKAFASAVLASPAAARAVSSAI